MAQFAIIGGGVVGLAVAVGLSECGHDVMVFDEGDFAFRASRGNFGLVWVQGKGVNEPAYARWTAASARAWPEFARRLLDSTGVDVSLQQRGGFSHFLDEASLVAKVAAYDKLKTALGQEYPFDVLRGKELAAEEPHLSPHVVGSILHHQDGHVNPLRLLRALAAQARLQGVTIHNDSRAASVQPAQEGFDIHTESGKTFRTQRIVLCAGLGAAKLGPTLGFQAPVRPQRGQILVTEKLPVLLHRPASTIRQVDEGSVQIGATAEEVGFDDSETIVATADLARNAARLFPRLGKAKLVRSWAALRIMSPDGLPIYQQSVSHPGACMVTCHSGITLAAAHATLLPRWIEGSADAPDLTAFGEQRFHADQPITSNPGY